MPPFSIANIAYCQGNVSPIQGEEPLDFWILAVDEIHSFDDEMTKDRSEFLRYDFYSYENISGEVLSDGYFMENKQNQALRKYRYQKKRCQETWPDKPEVLYGKPFDFYESLNEPEIFDVSNLVFRHEWRSYFEHTLGLKPKAN